jgi:hypothetical protein
MGLLPHCEKKSKREEEEDDTDLPYIVYKETLKTPFK